MSDDIKKYKQLVESSFQTETMHTGSDLENPQEVAQLLSHMFQSGVDKQTLKDVLMGHKNDPHWALETLNHLENMVK